jgi:hypothetical protein
MNKVPGRNEKCPCDSSKKYKYSCMSSKSKKRFEFLNVQFDDRHYPDGKNEISVNLFFDMVNNRMAIKNAETDEELVFNDVTIERGYFKGGENGALDNQKVLLRISLDSGKPYYTGFYQSLKKFDYIFGIDTKMVTIDGKAVYLGLAQRLIFEISECGILYDFIPFKSFPLLQSIKPKNENWFHLINLLCKFKLLNGKRIGLVVDSDLGELDNYNAKRMPYFNSEILPEIYEFIFSSDAAMDTPLNQLIKSYHKISKELATSVIE